MEKNIEENKNRPFGIKIISLTFFCLGMLFVLTIISPARVWTLPVAVMFFALSIGIFQMKRWAHSLVGFCLFAWIALCAAPPILMISKLNFQPASKEWLAAVALLAFAFLSIVSPSILIYFYLKQERIRSRFE